MGGILFIYLLSVALGYLIWIVGIVVLYIDYREFMVPDDLVKVVKLWYLPLTWPYALARLLFEVVSNIRSIVKEYDNERRA